MNFPDLLADFVLYLRHEKQCSNLTLLQYQSHARAYYEWLKKNGHPAPGLRDFTVNSVRQFYYSRSEVSLRPRTLRGILHSLRSLGEFCVRRKLLPENPALAIPMPRLDPPVRDLVSDEEMREMFTACERFPNKRRRSLARAVLYVLVYGGLRRDEVCNLKVNDIDMTTGALRVLHGKGDKARTVYLNADALASVTMWLKDRFPNCRHDYLFAVDTVRRLHHNGFASLIEEIKTLGGMAGRGNIKPHSMRHWRATDLMRMGVDLKTISVFLGHSDLRTTSIYLHTNESALKAAGEVSVLNQEPNIPMKIERQIEEKARRRIPLR